MSLRSAGKRLGRMFGYDAVDDRGRRKSPPTVTYGEDKHLTDRKRRILSATTRDLARNFAIASWAIRKHLDYVTAFSLQAKTDDAGFNDVLETAIASVATKERFEISQRHPMSRAVRITEACRVKDGDALWVKLAPPASSARGKIQAIEADRIKTPKGPEIKQEQWYNGVQVSGSGTAIKYAIHNRQKDTSRMVPFRMVPAANCFVHGFYDRFDQVRGVSPVAAALNWFQDTYEGFEYALAKVKVSQLFGLAFYREADVGIMGSAVARATADTDGDGVADAGYKVDLGRGPFQLDLDPGDRAEFLETHTPAAETTDFLKLMIHVALKSLDIPYSFFDESFTNFYGSRGGLIQYLKSCRAKAQDVQMLLDAWTKWRLGLLVEDGLLKLPRGKMFDWLQWEWVPDGVPWWDPVKEVRGNAMGVAAGFTNPIRVCREVGTDVFENIDKTAEVVAYAKSKGLDLVFADSTAFRPEITTNKEETQ